MPSLRQTIDRVLARPREAGTAEAEEARRIVAEHLGALGYRVTFQRFRFHPSGLLGFPILGGGLILTALLVVPLLALPAVPGWGALLVWVAGVLATLLLAGGVGFGRLPLGEPREDANLVAVRAEGPVRRWVVAHLDSKAQAQSMAGRLVAVWLLGVALAVLSGLALARLASPLSPAGSVGGGLLALVAGSLAGRGRLRGRSQGARDNGSGVLAALALAEASTDPGTGILISGAEEFGLVGSRVFAQVAGPALAGAEVVNLDTLDQEGDLYLVTHDGRGAGLAAAVAQRLDGLGIPVRSRRLPLGILVDSLPLARAGASAVTVGRLTWSTLRVIHTPADRPDGLSLELAERVGRALAPN